MKFFNFKVALAFPILFFSLLSLSAEKAPPYSSISDRFQKLKDSPHSDPKARYQEINELWFDISSELKENIKNPEVYSSSDGSYDKEDLESWRKKIARKFSLLKQVSGLRVKVLRDPHTEKFIQWNEGTLKTMALELSIIPYKFIAYVYEKSYWFFDQISQGIFGIWNLILEILLFFAMFAVPYVFFRASKKVDEFIDSQKQKSFYISLQSNWHRNLIPILSVISVYVPWVSTFLALRLLEKLLSLSEFSEFSVVLPYGYFYVYYKIFRVTLEIGLHELSLKVPESSKGEINSKIKNTSRLLGLFLLFIYSLKSLIQAVLGKSLIFLTIEPFFGYIVLAILFYLSAKWEKEIEAYLGDTNIKLFQLYSSEMEKRYSLFLSLPGLILITLHFSMESLIHWSSRFEYVKVIYAKVLRVKFETTRVKGEEKSECDDDYIHQFRTQGEEFYNTKIFETNFFRSIENQMSQWKKDLTFEQTVAVYGAKGCGKTMFLEMLAARVSNEELRCFQLDVPPKIFTEKTFESFFKEVFELSKDQKTVVLIDNAHNLFLSTIGGFEIYKSFLQKIEESNHIFWVASFNEYSWMFLNSVLGKNQYFRIEQKVPRWPLEQIKDLILSLHKKTDYDLVYDEIFKSSQKLQDGVTSSESRFFYLLWERCSGSPGTAVNYWFRSLQGHGSKLLKVCLPRENPINELNGLHQEMHFVYASLIKHENLNISEGTRATNLPRPVVKQAFFRGVEEGFLQVEKGRYSVNLDWNDDLKKFLKGKNLVYDTN